MPGVSPAGECLPGVNRPGGWAPPMWLRVFEKVSSSPCSSQTPRGRQHIPTEAPGSRVALARTFWVVPFWRPFTALTVLLCSRRQALPEPVPTYPVVTL